MHLEDLKRQSNDSKILQIEASNAMREIQGDAIFGIHIAELGLLVSKDSYCEVLDKIHVNALPNVHPWLSGIINLRGNLIPVFDLLLMLEEGTADNKKKRRLMVIGQGDKAAGLWIDGFPEIKDSECFQPLNELPVLPQLLQRFVASGYREKGQVWIDVKFEELFKALGRHQQVSEEAVTC
jgi:twitching motility protein PilI